jgi:DNA-binding winged helix-turn-helix (wHTH) protein/tetratricopeptide (TPR) repeat protein
VKIEELPFQLLLVLIETPGDVVSKETLRSRLWSDRIFGELDSVLHVATAKLREALQERAGTTQYIETIRRRGYRFNGQVEPIFSSAAGAAEFPVPAELSAAPVENVTDPTPPGLPAAQYSPRPATAFIHRRAFRLGVISFLLLLTAGVGAMWLYRSHRSPLVTSSDRVVLGGFTNLSSDDTNNGLGRAFRVKLEESPYLNLVPEQSFLRLVPEPGSASLQQLLKACTALGGKLVITGTVAGRNSEYEITTAARNCAGGKLLASETIKMAGHDTVLTALDRATDQLRKSLGEPDASLQKFNVPVAQATTSSLAALRAFTLGEEKREVGQEFEAIHEYKLAVDLDPNFALAYARLGTIYSNAAEMTQSAAYFQKAFDLREHTTDRERLYITAHNYSISGQIERSIEAYELWRSLYPRDASPDQNLAVEYLELGKPDKALSAAQAAVQIDASSSLSESILARAYLETGDRAPLHTLCGNAQNRKGDNAMLHASCYLLAFLENDEAAMEKQIQWSRGNAAESEVLDDVAWVAMYQGKLSSGRKLFAQARQSALTQGFAELAATVDVDEAILEAEFGYPRPARTLALDALRLAPDDVNIQTQAALALARSGDTALAESKSAKAAAQAPLDTILNSAELPSIRAAVDLQKHDPQAAIQALEAARPYDTCSALALAPAYYRGLAYQDAGEVDKAAAEYRSVLEHAAMAPDSPYIPLAALQLSKALQRAGDQKGATEARRRVEEAWRHADAGFIPLRRDR